MKHLSILMVIISVVGMTTNGHASPSCSDWPNERFFSEASAEDVRVCLSAGMSHGSRDGNGRTALHWAAAVSNDPWVIVELLTSGANPELTDLDGKRPIHVAAGESQHPAILFYLIIWGSNVEAEVSGEGGRCPWSTRRCALVPLHLAAARPDGADYIAILLAAGANVDARDEEGRTPLHHAASASPDSKSIRILLRAGASVNQANKEGQSPLHMAARQCESASAIIPLLLDSGASPDHGDQDRSTPLMWAARLACSSDVMKMLVDASRQPCAVDRRGRTVLQQWQQNPNLTQDDTYWLLHEECKQ